ncbi:MAG TPA: hypothetical protein VG941_02170 [Candidatus Paceibacterota bacterium]|nr:hypothetical protein [Candidatus Paceibacterota bacterium]
MADEYILSITGGSGPRELKLEIEENGSVKDQLIISLDMRLDTLLVTSIDKILKKNRIDLAHLKSVTIGENIDPASVAYGIARAVAEALKPR